MADYAFNTPYARNASPQVGSNAAAYDTYNEGAGGGRSHARAPSQGPFLAHDDQDAAYGDGGHMHNGADSSYDEKAGHASGGNAYAATGSKQRGAWTQNDRGAFARRSLPVKILRSIACIILWALIIILSIVCLFVTFARPPNVAVSGLTAPSASDVQVDGTTFSLNSTINFAISNPNSFTATIKSIEAHAYDKSYPNIDLGKGSLKDVKIGANQNTTIHFPFAIVYDPSKDSNGALLSDIASQCGLSLTGGSGSGKLDIKLKVKVRLSILSISVPFTINRDLNFDCPQSAIKGALDQLGLSIGNIASSVSGLLGRAAAKRASLLLDELEL